MISAPSSISPSLHHSITPPLHHSITPFPDYGTIDQKRPVRGFSPVGQNPKGEEHEPKNADQDLVAAFDDHAGFRGPHVHGAQRKDFQSGVRDGKHGGPPFGRVFADA